MGDRTKIDWCDARVVARDHGRGLCAGISVGGVTNGTIYSRTR